MIEKQKINTACFDSLGRKVRQSLAIDFPLSQFVRKYKKSSTLFGKYGPTASFFTQDSKLYLTPAELKMARRKERIVRIVRRLDSLNSRSFEKTRIYQTTRKDLFGLQLQRQYATFREKALELVENSRQKVTLVKMWNLSIVGAVIFGMFMMTMVYKYLGQSVSAKIQDSQVQTQAPADKGQVMGASAEKGSVGEIDPQYFTQLLDEKDLSQAALEKKILEMVKRYPIEAMVPEIAKQDPTVAAFIIGIAKQESDWGVHVPVYKGQDCYNYWGYRGKNPVGTGGHTCFASPEDAVDTVAKRIEFLVSNQKLNTPNKMIIWKCGDCSWDNQKDMQIWINTVSMYFQKLNT